MRLSTIIEDLSIPVNAKMGVTGTRRGMTSRQTIRFMDIVLRLFPRHLRHGCCMGADQDAHDVFYTLMTRLKYDSAIYGYPPREKTRVMQNMDKRTMFIHEPMEFLARNRAIVEDSEYLIAFPDTPVERTRSGTWSTTRYAHKIGKPLIIVLPSGSTVKYPFLDRSNVT